MVSQALPIERHREGQQLPGAGTLEMLDPLLDQEGQGRAWQPGPISESQSGAVKLEVTRAAPALDIWHLYGIGDELRLGWDVHLHLGLAQQGLWLGKAGL